MNTQMTCPACRTKLPARCALATRRVTVTCRRCGRALRATTESAASVARTVFKPSTTAGLAVGFAGVWIGLSTGRWWPLVLSLAAGVVISFVASWWVATRTLVFELA